jgi:topoisomerase-4 subunit A
VILRSGKKKADMVEEEYALAESVEVTGWKTVGTKLQVPDLKEIVPVQTEENASETEAPTLF